MACSKCRVYSCPSCLDENKLCKHCTPESSEEEEMDKSMADSTSRGSSGSNGDESSEEEDDDAGSDITATNFESVTNELLADLQGVTFNKNAFIFVSRVCLPRKKGATTKYYVTAGCMGLPITALIVHELMSYIFLDRTPSQLMDIRELEIEYNRQKGLYEEVTVPEQIRLRRDVSMFAYIFCCITTCTDIIDI